MAKSTIDARESKIQVVASIELPNKSLADLVQFFKDEVIILATTLMSDPELVRLASLETYIDGHQGDVENPFARLNSLKFAISDKINDRDNPASDAERESFVQLCGVYNQLKRSVVDLRARVRERLECATELDAPRPSNEVAALLWQMRRNPESVVELQPTLKVLLPFIQKGGPFKEMTLDHVDTFTEDYLPLLTGVPERALPLIMLFIIHGTYLSKDTLQEAGYTFDNIRLLVSELEAQCNLPFTFTYEPPEGVYVASTSSSAHDWCMVKNPDYTAPEPEDSTLEVANQ